MNESVNLWEVLAGVAVFMLGMRFLEDSLQAMAGRSFKLFLKRNTSGRFRAVAGGTIVTAVLQSSSVVNLLVLAFVGASLLTMQNALAVILGANLGTTISNWVIATVGFSYQISDFAYPLTGVAGILAALSTKGSRLHHWSMFLLGFSFIFLGLGFIKSGIEVFIVNYDFSGFSEKASIIQLLAGFVITSLIQSSSATMAIILSLLFANGITLQAAMAVTLGSEIGTTVKVAIASAGNNAVKKQVATGNLLFNIFTAALVFLFLPQVHLLITEIAGIQNPLIALVAFQSFVNLLCIILFLPVLPWVSKWLENLFLQNSDHAIFISKAETSIPDIAIQAIEYETKRFLQLNLLFTLNSLYVDSVPEKLPQEADEFVKLSLDEQYEYLKVLHGKILAFNSKLLQQKLNETESRQLERIVAGARNTMYAAKSVHDAAADIQQLKNSSKDEKYRFYREVQNKVSEFCEKANEIFESEDPYPALAEVYRQVVKEYEDNLQGFYHPGAYSPLEMQEISTLLNFNREMISALKSIVFALKELLLQKNEGDKFEALPGFIR